MNAENNSQNNEPSYGIAHQYLKDLSFEVPNHHFMNASDKTAELQMNVDIKTSKLQDSVYEVVLHMSINSVVDEQSLFLLEIDYAAIVHALNISDENVKELLYIEVPHMIFPFARSIVATTTQNGGFPPVLLGAINFVELYQQNYQDT